MATTESERSVPNARHTHELGGLTTTDFATSVYGGTPPSIDPDDAGAAGTATTVSRSDHQHQFTCATAAALTRTNTPGEGVATTSARSDHVHSLGPLPWGVVARQVLTANDTTRTGDATTDMVLNNVSVIAGHLYAVIIQGLGDLSAATGSWQLNLLVNGTYVDTFSRITNEVAGASRHPINGMCTWEAPTTQATDDFTVQADERTGTADLTLIGGTDATSPPRTMLIVDLGDAP